MSGLPGRFNDGRSAVSRKVVVTPGDAGLDIRGEDGLMVAFWHLADLRADGELPNGAGVRLRCAADPAARLTMAQAEFVRPLLPRPSRLAWIKAVAVIAATAVTVVVLWLGIPAAAGALGTLVPPAWEQRWGDSLAHALEQRWGTCRQPAGEAALTLLAARLSTAIAPELRPRRLVVVRHPDQNAVALPGGTVLVFSGLVANAADADELAGVLAHEFTHLRLRHPTAAAIRAVGIGAVTTLVTGDSSGVVASGTAMALAGAYSREDESAADIGAVELLKQAGIGTQGLVGFFRRLGDGPAGPAGWLSTHPDSQGRARMVESLAAPAGTAALAAEHWAAIKTICGPQNQ